LRLDREEWRGAREGKGEGRKREERG